MSLPCTIFTSDFDHTITIVFFYTFIKFRCYKGGSFQRCKETSTNTDNKRGTITISRCGISSGVYGPRFQLVKSENIDIQTFKGDFANKHKAPPGSKFVPIPNSYMTDKVWNELSTAFAKGLSDIPFMKDYPELWMFLTLDVHGSHLQGYALKIFADYNNAG